MESVENDDAALPPSASTLEIDRADFQIPHRHDDYGEMN
jgi:hypothetical protein